MWGAPETSRELKTFMETPHMAEELLFSMFPLILILNFYLVSLKRLRDKFQYPVPAEAKLGPAQLDEYFRSLVWP